MNEFLILIVGGLVTWRVSRILAKENGPLFVFTRFRAYLAGKQKRSGGFYDMISCVRCVSMYVGAVAAIAPAGTVFEWLVYTLAFSAITSLIEAYNPKEA